MKLSSPATTPSRWSTDGGNRVAESDFVAKHGLAIFYPGQTSVNGNIGVIGDARVEPASVRVMLINADGGTLRSTCGEDDSDDDGNDAQADSSRRHGTDEPAVLNPTALSSQENS